MAVTATVGLISNPHSGHNRDRFPRHRARLDRCPGLIHRVTDGIDAVHPALEECLEAGVRALAINGGDGTVATVLAQLERLSPAPPAIVILPAGTANMTAGDVGVPGSLARAVERFCNWVASGAPELRRHWRPMLQLRHGQTVRHGFFLGGGAVIAGTEYAHERLHARGLRDDFSLLLGVGRTLWGVARRDRRFLAPEPMTLSIDGGGEVAVDGLVLAMSTLEVLAFGMRPFWGYGAGPARLTLIEHGCRSFIPSFLRIAAGHPGADCRPGCGYRSHNFARVRLRTRGRLNLDGELFDLDGEASISTTRLFGFLRP